MKQNISQSNSIMQSRIQSLNLAYQSMRKRAKDNYKQWLAYKKQQKQQAQEECLIKFEHTPVLPKKYNQLTNKFEQQEEEIKKEQMTLEDHYAQLLDQQEQEDLEQLQAYQIEQNPHWLDAYEQQRCFDKDNNQH